MEFILPDGKTMMLPNDVSDDELAAVIGQMTGPDEGQKAVAGDEDVDLWGPFQHYQVPQQERHVREPLPTGAALTPSKQLLKDDPPLKDPYVDPFLVATSSAAVLGKTALAAGMPLGKAALRALAGGGISAVADYPVGAVTEEVIPEKWQPWFNIGAGVLSGFAEDKLLQKATGAGEKLAKLLTKKPAIEEVVSPQAPVLRSKIEQSHPETPTPTKSFRASKNQDVTRLRLKSRSFDQAGKHYELLETGPYGAVKAKSGRWGFYVRDSAGNPTNIKGNLVDDKEQAAAVLGAVREKISYGGDVSGIDLVSLIKSTKAEFAKEKAIKGLVPQKAAENIFGNNVSVTRVSKFGTSKWGDGKWYVFDGNSRFTDKAGQEGYKFFAKHPFDTESEAIEAMQFLGKKIVKGDKFGQVTEMAKYWKQWKDNKLKAESWLGRYLSKGYKYGEDKIPASLIDVVIPVLKGQFKGEAISREVVVGKLVELSKANSLVVNGQLKNSAAKEVMIEQLEEIHNALDWFHQWGNVKGNIDNVNREIRRAFEAKEISKLQYTLMNELNRRSNFPLTFGIDIYKRSGARASYNAARRIMSLDPTKHGPIVYTHEFGHWGFYEALTGAERMGAIREIADIVERGELAKYIPMVAKHPGLAVDEAEIFAEMFSQYALNHVLPEGLSQKVVNSIVKVAKATKDIALRMLGKETLDPGMKKYFQKIAGTPDVKLQPGNIEAVYLPRGALATISREEAVESLNNMEFLVGNKNLLTQDPADVAELNKVNGIDQFQGLGVDTSLHAQEVVDPEKLDDIGKVLFADWMRNLVEYGLKPGNMHDEFEMLERARLALRKVTDPALFDKLLERQGGNRQLAEGIRDLGNDIATSLEQRAATMDLPPLARYPAESANKLMESYYANGGLDSLDGPWWGGPLTQARLGPAVVMSTLGGLEFNTEDGVSIPFLNNMKVSFNPTKAAIYGGAVLGMTNFPGQLLRGATKGATEKLWEKLESNTPVLFDAITNFHPTMRTDPAVYKHFKDFLRVRPAVERQYLNSVAQLKESFSHDELCLISDIIEQEGPNWVNAPQKLKDQAKLIQAWLQDIRKSLVDAGIPMKDVDKYGTNYLPRAYIPKIKFGHPVVTAKSHLRSLYLDYLSKRGLTKKFSTNDYELQTALTDLGGVSKIKPGQKIYQFNNFVDKKTFYVGETNKSMLARLKEMPEMVPGHVWEVDKYPGKSKIVLRRDFTGLEREIMGEERNAAFRLAKFVRQASHDVALGSMFKKIASNTEHTVDPTEFTKGLKAHSPKYKDKLRELDIEMSQRDYVKVPLAKVAGTDTYKFGALAGKYVAKDVYKVLRMMTSSRSSNEAVAKVKKYWGGATKLWKIGKTAFNPATHGYNWTANSFMSFFDGRNPVKVISQGGWHLARKDEVYQRAVNAGMLDSNILRGELDLGSFLAEIEKVKFGEPVSGGANLIEALAKYSSRMGKKGLHKALRTYEIGDEVFKLGVFAQEIKKGASDAQAIEKANSLFFDYRDIPPGIAAIRDWGIMPFVSYTYKAVPVLARTMIENPHRILGTLLFFNMLNEISYGIDYGEGAKAQKEYEERNMPDYMREQGGLYGTRFSGNVRIPKKLREKFGGRTIEGQSEHADISHQLPLGDVLSNNGVFSNYPFSFHPGMSLAVGLLKGVDPQFMKELANSNPITDQDKLDSTMAKVRFAVRTLLPNLPFIPGQYSYEKMGNALTSAGVIPPELANKAGWTGEDYYGGKVSLPKELFGMAGLLKTRSVYPEQEFISNVKEAGGGVYKAGNKLKRGYMDRRSTESELEGMRINFQNTIQMQAKAIQALAEQRNAAPDPGLRKYSNARVR